MRIDATAHQDWEDVVHREPILGVEWHKERRKIYRVRIGIDHKFFTSQQKYKTFEAADRAAKRIKQKLGKPDA